MVKLDVYIITSIDNARICLLDQLSNEFIFLNVYFYKNILLNKHIYLFIHLNRIYLYATIMLST